MKKKIVKQLMAGTMATTMAVTMLAGCGDSKSEDGSDAAAESTTEDNSDKPDTWIADRTITVQAYVDDIGNTLPTDFNNTATMKKITELTGIKLDVKYTPGDSDAKVMASQLASGTIPDVIVSYLDDSTRPEFPLLLKAAQEDMFADVSEYMKNSEVYSKYYEEGYLPDDTYENIVFRSDLDGVYLWQMNIDEIDRSLEYNADEEYVGGMYIQSSIAEDLGIDPRTINTQDQLYDLLVQIKEGGYKDDNGNDVYPLGPKYWGGSADALDFVTAGLRWGVSDNYNLDDDGNVKHIAETDYVYDQINYVRTLLDEGLMNPEFFTMDSTRAEEVSKNHNSAIIADVHNYEEIVYGSDEWVPLGPINDIQGDNKEVVHGKSKRGCMAISSEAENPEEIFQFFDWLSTPEGQIIAQYGAEGVSYDMVDGKPVLKDEVVEKLNAGDTDYLINEVGAGFGGTGNYFFEFVLTNKNNIDNFGETRPGASSGESAYARSVQIAEEYPVEKKLVPGLDATAYMSADELADVKTQMDLLNWDETFVQACFAESDEQVKSIVESFRAQLKSAGIERFEDYVKGIYEENPEAVTFYK
ncbi:MAG: extracellular solute-binding protein [Clostridia bacterium]|nr:extracellular solute-binding protein [Clostridia bacterium]NCC44639.1 extracellular solute-binding protein [Clostridia bacterium]